MIVYNGLFNVDRAAIKLLTLCYKWEAATVSCQEKTKKAHIGVFPGITSTMTASATFMIA